MCSDLIACWDMRDRNLDYAALRKIVGQWREYAPNFYGDFYPLTPHNLDSAQWIAWQFDRPESGEGMVQAFRRAESVYTAAQLKLQGLDPNAEYVVTDIDKGKPVRAKGGELMEKGLSVEIGERPGAVVITYKR
jgi:alpha-galactosidase